MATVNLDGLTVDLPAEVAGSVQNFVQQSQKAVTELSDRVDSLQTELDEVQSELQAALDEKEAAEGRADALEAASEERGDSDEEGEGFYVTPAELDELLIQRMETLQHLAPAFEEDFKFDSIDDDSLYIQAYTNITGEEPDDELEMGYVRGVVDMAISQFNTDEEDAAPATTAPPPFATTSRG
jgi:outer membrane murein-binding lipoprotein Lpp